MKLFKSILPGTTVALTIRPLSLSVLNSDDLMDAIPTNRARAAVKSIQQDKPRSLRKKA